MMSADRLHYTIPQDTTQSSVLIPRKCSHRWQARLPTYRISFVYLPLMPNGQGVVYSKCPPTYSLRLYLGYFILVLMDINWVFRTLFWAFHRMKNYSIRMISAQGRILYIRIEEHKRMQAKVLYKLTRQVPYTISLLSPWMPYSIVSAWRYW